MTDPNETTEVTTDTDAPVSVEHADSVTVAPAGDGDVTPAYTTNTGDNAGDVHHAADEPSQ